MLLSGDNDDDGPEGTTIDAADDELTIGSRLDELLVINRAAVADVPTAEVELATGKSTRFS